MELLTPDTLFYISIFIFTAFFLNAALILSEYHVNKHVGLQQKDMCIVQNVNANHLQNNGLTPYVYYKYKLVCSVYRKESKGEQDDEGPHFPMFFI
ncbi:hypothetical protein [Neobacillus jeddahensis]|uniref:hypothetical protein n=1 Tax=Neobacillus jeddahensis TaxID=1461580 RepID=UPI0005912876|nr:hypothetical protein [Neobacillus jeddahensis]